MPVLALLRTRALLATRIGGGVAKLMLVTDVVDNRTYQRAAGATVSGNIPLAGTYTGAAPVSIQAQVHKVSDNSVVKSWFSLSGGSISGGNWSGNLASVPQGGSYYVKVRASDVPVVGAAGLNSFSVGIVIVAYGQSNMNHMFTTVASPASPQAGTIAWSAGGGWATPPAADGARAFLNSLNTLTGIPVAIVNCALDGAPVGYLDPASSQWSSVVQPALAAIGDAEMMIVDQGEGDAAVASAASVWTTGWAAIHSGMAAIVGRTASAMPIVFAGMGTETAGVADGAWATIQGAIISAPTNITGAYFSHNNYDLTRVDGYHYDAAGLTKQGLRFAETCAQLSAGLTNGFPAWNISGSATVDATHSTVDVGHSLGTDFTPTTGITGFEISGDNGATWSAATGVRTSATRITLSHASVPTTSARKIRYLYGGAPIISGLVVDNSAFVAPLNYTGANLSPTPTASLPTPTWEGAAQAGSQTGGGPVVQTATGFNLSASGRKFVIIGINGPYSPVEGVVVTPDVGTAKSAALLSTSGAGADNVSQLWAVLLDADANSATSCTVACSWASAPYTFAYVNVWSVSSGDLTSTTPTATNAGNSAATAVGSIAVTLTVPAGGFVIAVSEQTSTASSAALLSGVGVTPVDRGGGLVQGTRTTAADAANVAAGSATVTATYAGATAPASIAVAAFR